MARAPRQLELRGVFASAITPRRAGSQDPDFSGSLDLLDFLAGGGVQGICLLDAAGEFLNYTFSERQRMVYLGVKRSRVPLIAGVSHSTLAGALQLADEAISSGADGLLLMPPYFFRYSPPEIEEFYMQFAAEAAGAVPILVHNLPQMTSTMEFDSLRRLMDSGRFAGISDASGDWEFFERLLSLKSQRPIALLSGSDGLAALALARGADAVISPTACAVPELMVALHSALRLKDEARASALNARLLEFLNWNERFPWPVAIKRAVELRGQKSAAPLVPLAPDSLRALEQFSAWFLSWLPETRKAAAHA